jgi:hypothetical protein
MRLALRVVVASYWVLAVNLKPRHHVAALLFARKLLILLEPVISSLRGAKRRGNRRCLE